MVKRLNENELREYYLDFRKQEKKDSLVMSIFNFASSILFFVSGVIICQKFNIRWAFLTGLIFSFIFFGLCGYRIYEYYKIEEEIQINRFE